MAETGKIHSGLRSAALVGLGLVTALVVYQATSMNLLLLLVGGAVFVLLVLVGYTRPDMMFLALVAVSILSPIDFAVKLGGMPRMGPTRAVMLAFLAVWLLRLVVHGRLWERGRLPWLPLKWFILLYLSTGYFASLFSISPATSLMAVTGRELLEQFIMFYLFIYFLEDREFAARLLRVVFYATVLVCLFALFEELTHINPLLDYFPVHEEEKVFYRAGLLRVRATFFHPIALGCYILLILPLALAEFIRTRGGERPRGLVPLLGLLALTLFLTVSRAPWAFAFFELGIFLAWKTWKNVYRLFLISVLGALCVIGAVLAYQLNDTVHGLFEPIVADKPGEGTPAAYRVLLRDTVLEQMKSRRAVHGYGPNAFDLVGLRAGYGGQELILKSPDNHYARMLLEYGLPGTGALVLLLAGACGVCLRSARRLEGRGRVVAVGCLASVAAFALVNWTASMFTMYPLGMIFWMVVALAWRLPDLAASGRAARTAGEGS